MKEYITIVAQLDQQFKETVRNVANGLIKEINYESVYAAQAASGGLAKSVSVP